MISVSIGGRPTKLRGGRLVVREQAMKQGSKPRNLLRRRLTMPRARFLLMFSDGDAQARRQQRLSLANHEALELRIFCNKAGDVAKLDFNVIRFRGPWRKFVSRILSAHAPKSATARRTHQP